MTGVRLLVGFIVMGIAVPAILFFFIPLTSFTQLFVVAATNVLAWGIAHLAAMILARPRLEDRSPGAALRELDMSREKAQSSDSDPSI